MRHLLIVATMASLAAPVLADPPAHAPAHGRRAKERGHYAPRALSYDDRIYRGKDGRYYCKRSDGTTGLIIGGVAGGVLGNVIAPGGSKTLGTVVGAGAGALLGREIDRGKLRCG